MDVDQHTLGAAADELSALPDKVLGNIGKFLESLRHFSKIVKNEEDWVWQRRMSRESIRTGGSNGPNGLSGTGGGSDHVIIRR